MAERGLAHCGRCASLVEVVRPWPGFVWLKRLWYLGLLGLLVLMPIILSEITLLLPMAMVFALAGGPLFAFCAQEATCRQCGAVISRATDGSPQTR